MAKKSATKNWAIIVLAVVLAAILGISCYTEVTPEAHSATINNPPGLHRLFAWPEGVTVLALVLTLFFIAWQAILLRQSVADADAVSRRELRAYLTVLIGGAIYQERRTAENGGDLKFRCEPVLLNSGRTPARKIQFKARAAIRPNPLPSETHLPDGFDEGIGDSVLAAQQNVIISAEVEGFCQDADVQSIKSGNGPNGLYVWGRVTYEDVFGDPHYTRFCHQIYWLRDGITVRGNYVPGRNDAD